MACRQVCKNYICKISSCVTTRCPAVGRAASLSGPDTSHNNSTHYNTLQASHVCTTHYPLLEVLGYYNTKTRTV